MRFVAVLAVALAAAMAPAVAQASFGVESFFAANCKVNTCAKHPGETKEEELAHSKAEGFTQAGGHPNFGITDFKINTTGAFPNAAPSGVVTHIRTDVAPGVATNPEAPEKCSFEEFGHEFEPAPGVHTGLYEEPECSPGSEIGVNKAVVYIGPEPSPKGGDLPLEGSVFNLVQPQGLTSDFGVALPLPEALTEALFGFPTGQLYAHTLIEGGVEWGAQAAGTGKADYHDYFEINVSPSLPLISSRLIFNGRSGVGGARDFLTNPTSCTGTGPQTTTRVVLQEQSGPPATASYETLLGNENCAEVPFNPTFSVEQSNTLSDQPDELTSIFSLPHKRGATETDDSDVQTASVTLPEGMTLDPSAAAGLEACTPAQARIHSGEFGSACPIGSKIGTVALEVPGLPEGSLTGAAYLGGPESGPITAPPYTIYVVANSTRYGVSVRLKGEVLPNLTTGQVTTVFRENPEQPFNSLTIHFDRGLLTSVANPLVCGSPNGSSSFVPYSGTPASLEGAFGTSVTGCAASLPFEPTQSVGNEPAQAAGSTTFELGIERPLGNQYLTSIKNVLPPGLIGLISTVTPCEEPQAAAGTCASSSQIGTVAVGAGSGTPQKFSGKVYLTGKYEGAPYGLSIVVPPIAGPFSLQPVIARAKLEVKTDTAQVIATDAKVPTIDGGIPTRIRTLVFSINRQGFERNPTNCEPHSIVSTYGGSGGGEKTVSTALPIEGCSLLGFSPTFAATTSAKFSKVNGASLQTTITQPSGQANIKSVLVTLPRQLPSRLTTLQKACTEAVFAANPYSCPAESNVGTATAITPALPGKMTGPAYLVSHGGAAFPDLDLVLEDNGVRVILVGNTNIKNEITTTNFAMTPDVPVSSVTVNLPTGPHSALAGFGNLCSKPLYMPAVITAQNGKQIKLNNKIAVTGCPVQIVGHKVIGNTAYLTVQTFAAGRLTGKGKGASTVSRSFGSAQRAVSLKIPLTRRGRSRHRPFSVKLKVGFTPKSRNLASSSATVTVRFR